MSMESFNNKKEAISTDSFYRELTKIDFTKEESGLKVFNVDLDVESFVKLLSESDTLMPIASSDGVVSNVRETPSADIFDYSRSSRYFNLHTDGQYMPSVPEIVILHCVDPGTSDIPTVFADTKGIVDVLRNSSNLEEAKEYEFIFRNRKGLDFVRPLLEMHPAGTEPIMNIAIASPQCHLRPLIGSNKTQEDADRFYNLLGEIAEKNLKILSHTWKKNDAVVFDNLRLIHGRGLPEHKNLEVSDSERHLHRIWLSKNKLANEFSFSKEVNSSLTKEIASTSTFKESVIEIEKSIEISPIFSSDMAICLIKPDAYVYKDEIIRRIENAGLGIVRKVSHTLPDKFVEKLYADTPKGPLLDATMRHFLVGPSEILLVRGGEDIISKLLNTVGLKTNPALCDPESIRFLYGSHVPEELSEGLKYYRNAAHRPLNRTEADRDLNLFKDIK